MYRAGPKQYETVNGKDLMMLPADMILKTDPEFRKHSEAYYKDSQKLMDDFAVAYKKLTEVGFD